jgi:hypothetical protein
MNVTGHLLPFQSRVFSVPAPHLQRALCVFGTLERGRHRPSQSSAEDVGVRLMRIDSELAF